MRGPGDAVASSNSHGANQVANALCHHHPASCRSGLGWPRSHEQQHRADLAHFVHGHFEGLTPVAHAVRCVPTRDGTRVRGRLHVPRARWQGVARHVHMQGQGEKPTTGDKPVARGWLQRRRAWGTSSSSSAPPTHKPAASRLRTAVAHVSNPRTSESKTARLHDRSAQPISRE